MKKLIAVAALFLAIPAYAQAPSQYVPLDEQTWDQVIQALDDIPMSMNAHNAVRQILQQGQRQSQMRKSQKEAEERANKAHSEPKKP